MLLLSVSSVTIVSHSCSVILCDIVDPGEQNCASPAIHFTYIVYIHFTIKCRECVVQWSFNTWNCHLWMLLLSVPAGHGSWLYSTGLICVCQTVVCALCALCALCQTVVCALCALYQTVVCALWKCQTPVWQLSQMILGNMLNQWTCVYRTVQWGVSKNMKTVISIYTCYFRRSYCVMKYFFLLLPFT